MKTFFNIIIIITILSCSSNKEDKTRSHIQSVITDRTEEDFFAQPNAKELIKYLDINIDIWDEYIFRQGYLSEVDYNLRYSAMLPRENKLTGNNILRKHQIEEFIDSITNIVENPILLEEQKKSTIVSGISRELNYLSQFPRADSQLFIFSDLLENNAEVGGFSFYRNIDRKQLQHNPKSIATKLLNEFDTSLDYSNIEVIIVYQAKNSDDNLQFREILRVYDLIFEELKISYSVKANL
ncbi:hypothetical protein [Aequorivita vladivostokensis]|uniref:Uncharacterized protein n=1 Tax=Aequorivita vladivostokensis TaxID=171194 RepID=A0ABR5DM93_9FLAO|nr:hypothetical protein [Aequorivita vladivostokensis]KJJ39882.1 hypothetical protein MB09_01550 [Aequorivita vladivostokensis]